MNLNLLSRIMAQPWAVRREHLSLLTRLVIAGEDLPHPVSRGGLGAQGTKPKRGGVEREVVTPAGDVVKQVAQPGYVPLNWESWDAAAAEHLPVVPAGVTVMMVWGCLGRGWSAMEKWWLDAVDYDDISRGVEATPEGGTVVLWMRSPGGIITGCPETAGALRWLGKKRRILTFTDTLCASAAYWLAAQCERIDGTQTADVGSIGVYCAFYDFCAYLEKAGIKLELFKAGAMKAAGLPGNPLSDDERDHLQAGVMEAYDLFTADVLRNREIGSESMQGQCLDGARAKAANLVDDNGWESAGDYFRGLGKGKI